MKSIEEIKIELTLKKLAGEEFTWKDIYNLPQNDGLRSFICSLGAKPAFLYAKFVDYSPHEDTREACYRHQFYKLKYTELCYRALTEQEYHEIY